MEVRCSTDLGVRKCNKFLGKFELLIGQLYCKSCKQANQYHVITEAGLKKAMRM